MPQLSTVGKVLLKHSLPADMHEFIDTNELDKKGISTLFNRLAEKPELYKDAVSTLSRLGFEVSTRLGSTVKLSDLLSPIDKDAKFKQLNHDIDEIRAATPDKKQREIKLNELYSKFIKEVEKELIDVGVAKNQTLAKVIRSGSRGSVQQYRQTVFSPFTVQDAKGNVLVDFPIQRSFAEGLSLPEYLSSTFGSRQGEVAKKLCIFEDAEILTADFQSAKIKDIKVGDYVLGSDLHGEVRKTKVTKVFNQGLQDCWEYKFRKGNTREFITVIATEDHKILNKRRDYNNKTKSIEVSSLGTLKPGDGKNFSHSAILPSTYIEDANDFVPEHRALHLGLILGDGCVTYKSKRSNVLFNHLFSCADPLLLSDVKGYLKTLNLKTGSPNGYSMAMVYDKPEGKLHPIKIWLRELGLAGTNSKTKFIPDEVWTWDKESTANLISGLISTDGSISLTERNCLTIRFAVVSERIAYTLKDLLERKFQIYCTPIKKTDKTKIRFAVNDLYTFAISHRYSVKRFVENIKLVGKKRLELEVAYAKFCDNNAHNLCEEYPVSFVSKIYKGKLQTYDIEVDHPEHLFVLKNMMISSNSVAKAGYFSKQLSRATMTLKVEEHDCGTDNGIEVPTDDKDSVGCYLAKPVASYNKNNEVTSRMLNDLKNRGIQDIIVRSPITCQASRHSHAGAVCQLCAGKREKGTLPPLGDYVGITAASTLGEPLAQGQLNVKHTSGSAGGANISGGFKLIEQLANIPDTFKHRAAIAEKDGVVAEIRKAPQGGFYIKVDDTEYYVLPGFSPTVKLGDEVEQGDVLSEGIINPADVVRLKGIGEGRRYFTKVMKKAFDDSGMGGISRRNFELISKAGIDHVKITSNDGLGDHLPGEVVSYQNIEKDYHPRPDAIKATPDHAHGKYLEEPVLHYTIGTRVTKRVSSDLKKHHIEYVTVHNDAPPFEPEMQRMLDVPVFEPDWMHQLYSTNLERRLMQSVNTGAQSNLKGPSPVPGLAYGVSFGLPKRAEDYEVYTDESDIS